MKIAVLLSTYNGEKFLREQIESILAQKGTFDMDLWVRDDGSKDSTRILLNKYEEEGKLRWYTGDNLKPAYSFLELLYACGEYDYYAFSDQDDYWMNDKIMSGVEMLKPLGVPALYCANAELVDENMHSLGRNVYKVPLKTDFYTLSCAGGILGCTMIFNKKLAEIITNSIKLTSGIIMHDFYVALVCAAVEGIIIYDEIPHMKYRQHRSNVVGVAHGNLIVVLKSRLFDITHENENSIADQARTFLKDEYLKQKMPNHYLKWLKQISIYKKSFFARVRLAFSSKTRYININMGLKNRLSILMGNR